MKASLKIEKACGIGLKTLIISKVRTAKDHGRKLRSRLGISFSRIVHFNDMMSPRYVNWVLPNEKSHVSFIFKMLRQQSCREALQDGSIQSFGAVVLKVLTKRVAEFDMTFEQYSADKI